MGGRGKSRSLVLPYFEELVSSTEKQRWVDKGSKGRSEQISIECFLACLFSNVQGHGHAYETKIILQRYANNSLLAGKNIAAFVSALTAYQLALLHPLGLQSTRKLSGLYRSRRSRACAKNLSPHAPT